MKPPKDNHSISSPAASPAPAPIPRPYPTRYVQSGKLSDGTDVILRPIKPDDVPLMVRFHGTLSPETVYRRYFNLFKLSQRTANERLKQICLIDYDKVMVLVAQENTVGAAAGQIIGVGRVVKHPDGVGGEWAVVVSDPYQRRGLGTELIRRLIQFARDEKMRRLVSDILPDNLAMQRICQTLGMTLDHDMEEGVVRARLVL